MRRGRERTKGGARGPPAGRWRGGRWARTLAALMPREPRTGPREEPAAGRRPRSSAAGPPIFPLLGLVALIAVAIVFARMYSAGERASEPSSQAPAHVPFGDLPEEKPPTRTAGGGTARAATTQRAPEGLEADPIWQRALALGAKGDEALARSNAARQSGESALSQAASREARDAYDEALTQSAAWLEDLLGRYGDTDRQVRQISRVRDGWFRNLTALRRTTGRQ